LFGNFLEILALLNHRLIYFFVEENNFLYFDGEVILIGKRVGEHNAWSNTHRRDHKMVNNKVGHISLTADVEQNEVLFWYTRDDSFSFPRIEFED